jgi:hypothetical protein
VTPRRPARATVSSAGGSRRRLKNNYFSVEYRKGVRRVVVDHPQFGKLISDRAVPPDHEVIWFPHQSHQRARRWEVENAFSPSAWCNSRAAKFVSCFFMCEPALANKLLYTFDVPGLSHRMALLADDGH